MTNAENKARTCGACGTSMADGAYVCPNCNQAFCIACNTPIAVGPTTRLCRNPPCELYAKPFCDNCLLVEISYKQDDLRYPPSGGVSRWTWPMVCAMEQ